MKKDETGAIDSKQFLDAFLYLIIAIGAGTVVSMFLGKLMTFPFYIGAMLVGAVIRNVMDAMQKEIPMEEIGTLGGSCLSIFLGLAMIDMKLWQLAELALPLVVMLAAQTILMFVYAYFVVFNVLGRTYDAAVMTNRLLWFRNGCNTERHGEHAGRYRTVRTGSYRIHGSSVSREAYSSISATLPS